MNMVVSDEIDFFHDCPWLNIPPHRQAIIIAESQHPRGRLLGGASKEGKMSKLAALAAKRRKEKEAQKSSSAEAASESNDYIERLKQLHVTQSSRPENTTETAEHLATTPDAKQAEAPEDSSETIGIQQALPESGLVQHLRRPPSAFADVFTQSRMSDEPGANNLRAADDLLPKSTFDFSQPSPDDVFRRAQGSK